MKLTHPNNLAYGAPMSAPRPPLSERVRSAIERYPRSLKHLTREAKVDYQSVRRWYVFESTKLDADTAEALLNYLPKKPRK